MKKNNDFDEFTLHRQLVAGDEDAFSSLYLHYNKPVCHFVKKYIKSDLLAEDITQEIFIKIWDNRKRLKEVRSFKAYLFITARNYTINSLKIALRTEAAIGEVLNTFVQQRSSTEEELLHKEYLVFVAGVVESLPTKTREIFKQCRELGKSYDEVAIAMGISRNAIKNHMVCAMKILRSSVEKELEIPLSVLLLIWLKSR